MEKLTKLYTSLLALKFAKFIISGAFAFLIDTSILLFIKFLILDGNDVLVFNAVSIAKLISSTIGIGIMFILNRTWVFEEKKEEKITKQSVKYIIITLANLLIANLLLTFYVYEISFLVYPDITSNLSLITAIANLLTETTKMFISFLAYKYIVFR